MEMLKFKPSFFWRTYLKVSAILFLPVFLVQWLDYRLEENAMLRTKADFIERRAKLEELTRNLAEEFEAMAEHSAIDDDKETAFFWLNERQLNNSDNNTYMLQYRPSIEMEEAGSFIVTVGSDDSRNSPHLSTMVKSSSGRTIIYSTQAFSKGWCSFHIPLPKLMLFLMSATGLAVCWVMVGYYLKPMNALGDAAKRMASGDFSARVDKKAITGYEKLWRLGISFNNMADHIEKLIKSQKRLLVDVSHEIRAPLQRLSVALALINAGTLTDKAPLREAESDVKCIDAIIEELLTMIRTEFSAGAGKIGVSLRELLSSLIKTESFDWEQDGKSVEFSGKDVKIFGDAVLLYRAIRNIVHNAVRHTPDKGRVEIFLSEESGCAVVHVRDYGEGVEDDELEKIFLPFYRAQTTHTHMNGGTGLGLYIVRCIAEQHRGSCTASNTDEGGLLITFRLPITPCGA